MRNILILIATFSVFVYPAVGINTKLQERYSWNFVDFDFPNRQQTRQQLINSGEFIPSNNVPLGIEIWRDRYFVTIPRWLTGIASTLNYFTRTNNRSPLLIPYPNYEMNRIRPNESNYDNKIVSVFRLKVDVCDRLWFIDTGLIDIIGTYSQVITPRLFIYDLRTNTLIRRYTMQSTDISDTTLFGGNIVVDVTENTCNRAYAYIPDFGAYRMVVYSYEQNSTWRIRHPYYYFDPFATTFNIGGLSFIWVDGVFGCALSELQPDGFRTLYFSSISTTYEFAVSTRFLRDRNIASNTSTLLNGYRVLGTRGNHMQSTAHMYDESSGVLFYTLINRNGIGCWNSRKHANNFNPSTNEILATDDVTMIFPNDMVFDDNGDLWLLSDRLPVSNIRGLRENEVNHRLFTSSVANLVRGTVCDPNTRP